MTAPGAAELPSRLVLLGHPVAHSLSPLFQTAALRHAGLPLTYRALDVAPEQFDATVTALAEERAGGNVTIPHKGAMFGRCDVVTDAARGVRAVNTFWVSDGALHGDNTDIGGFDRAVRAIVDPARIKHVTLVGAGGSAAAVAAATARWPGVTLTIWNRTRNRADALAHSFDHARVEMELSRAVRDADLVVNATPTGLHDDTMPVALSLVQPHTALFDLVYHGGGTPWIRAGRDAGHAAADGLGMLVEQGALAFERWTGRAADRGVMWAALTPPSRV